MLSRTTFPPSPLHTSISISLSDNILNWSRNRKLLSKKEIGKFLAPFPKESAMEDDLLRKNFCDGP